MVYQKRGYIPSKQTSGEEMADIQIKEVSQQDAFDMWNRDNPDDPFVRNVPSWYDLDNWIVRTNDGEVVGVAGYSDKGDYGILGGLKARDRKAPKGGGGADPRVDALIDILKLHPKHKQILENKGY